MMRAAVVLCLLVAALPAFSGTKARDIVSVSKDERIEYHRVTILERQHVSQVKKLRSKGAHVLADSVSCGRDISVWTSELPTSDGDSARLMDLIEKAWRDVPTARVTRTRVYLISPAWRYMPPRMILSRLPSAKMVPGSGVPWFAMRTYGAGATKAKYQDSALNVPDATGGVR